MEQDGWRGFLSLCLKVKDPRMLNELFELFLTHEEKKDLGLRFSIVKELIEGKKTQREMAEELKVSIAKITRGSNALKILEDDVKELLEGHFRT